MLRQRLDRAVAGNDLSPVSPVGLSSSVAIYLEEKLKQAVNILITVTGRRQAGHER